MINDFCLLSETYEDKSAFAIFPVLNDVESSCCFRYGDTVDNEFYLNTHRSRSSLLAAINGLGYRPLGNGRNFQSALGAMRTQQFTSSRVRLATTFLQMGNSVFVDVVHNVFDVSGGCATPFGFLLHMLHCISIIVFFSIFFIAIAITV